jgi:uncharacterized protein Smg (DUF494 family)
MLTRLMDLVVLVAELSQNSDRSYRDLDKELSRRGYSAVEIEQAVFWFSSRGDTPERSRIDRVGSGAVRVPSELERMSLSSGCYGYLLRLLNLGIMDLEQFERVIARAIPVGPEKIHLGEIKAIACSVVFNRDLSEVEDEFLDQLDDDIPTT